MTTPEILPGAEAFTADGGPHGALVLHGFTGNPTSMRPVADAFVAAGYAVEMPRLPGHGTTVEDMATTSWDDWAAEAEAAYERLAARVDKVVVVGLSMGGTLTARLGTRHPEIAGLVFINAAAQPSADMHGLIQGMVDAGEEFMDGIGSDIADPDVTETAYARVPLAALLSMLDAVIELQDDLGAIEAPVLIMNSPEDHVVPPTDSDHLAESVAGPVERVTLPRSYHVATLDFDAERIQREAVAFAGRVTTS